MADEKIESSISQFDSKLEASLQRVDNVGKHLSQMSSADQEFFKVYIIISTL